MPGSPVLHSPETLERIEFHRNAIALLPDPGDPRPGIAVFILGGKKMADIQRFCTCSLSKHSTCDHLLALSQAMKAVRKRCAGRTMDEEFRASPWYRLASFLTQGTGDAVSKLCLSTYGARDKGKRIALKNTAGTTLLTYFSQGSDRARFIERASRAPEQSDALLPHRAAVRGHLARLTLSPSERLMLDHGILSQRLAIENSIWYLALYHGYLEFGGSGQEFRTAIEEKSGDFLLSCWAPEDAPAFNLHIPRLKVKDLLTGFGEAMPNSPLSAVHPVPLRSIFRVSRDTELDLAVREQIEVIQAGGEARYYDHEDLKRYRYGDLVYVRELSILAELERTGRERKFRAPERLVLKRAQVRPFLEEIDHAFEQGLVMDDRAESMKIYKACDRISISPEAVEKDWCWLSVDYGFGTHTLSLAEILETRQQGQRYIAVPDGWVDCGSPGLDGIGGLVAGNAGGKAADRKGSIRLSRLDLFKISASGTRSVTITGSGPHASGLRDMLDLKAPGDLPDLSGMTSRLRPYQEHGLQWLRFLQENGFGGLLCDDMGLGKTHQVMALMITLHKEGKGPFLVVCPTTVLSHWEHKIREHAPVLKAALHHGGDRNIEEALKEHCVILTSYGVLRRDCGLLGRVRWEIAVFDEAHFLKNARTITHEAARSLEAGIKIGMTGTPVENALHELKALFDLVLPGYLGTEHSFLERYGEAEDEDAGAVRREELSRLISPFILRRLKTSVLSELPEKIEDIRTCRLSDDQIKLYRDAIASRGRSLVKTLETDLAQVPYMHIFALLGMLKQICDHPALLEGDPAGYDRYASGKWELFKELLRECLESGQKIVVYSQYLGMIEIIASHLRATAVDFVTLTGSSGNRGAIIERFNSDPACRVFVGSLMAGGMGIDLVAASVVIHYDRWWNAAREDQATDRVHRIGQKRGVQVFKLVTEGTLEEKISALIERKRSLMESVIKEDDPGLLKTFTRSDLIDLLALPSGPGMAMDHEEGGGDLLEEARGHEQAGERTQPDR